MRCTTLLLSLFILYSCQETKVKQIEFSDNKVVAHRGAWKTKDLPHNSIAALKEAIRLNCAGSEFDVHLTGDDVLIVTHDHDYHGLPVEESTYEELAKFKLPNGETLPLLKDFINVAMNENKSTGLVLEIKPSQNGRTMKLTNKVVELVKDMDAASYIYFYISFGYDVLQEIERLTPEARTMYLHGSKTPQELNADGIDGLDYYVHKLKNNPAWVAEAKELGLILNAWSVRSTEDIDWLIANEFDLISSDDPELVLDRIKASPISDGYKLVWSDEFNYKGKPDSTKWSHEIGFQRNEEKQYYTDRLENSRVEKGLLTLETVKESIKNEAYTNTSDKDWKKNQPNANYTAASLTTNGLAEWKYGRIDIRAQLPKGRGMWPAIWMLGTNFDEVGWPQCGEIDIMEHVGFSPDSVFSTVHTMAYNHTKGTQKGKRAFVELPYDTFHVYSTIWTPEYIEFLLDDKIYNRVENEHKSTDEWPFDQPFHLKLNVAVGGMLGAIKGIDDSSFPNQMIVDFVRVYQREPK